MDEFSPGGGAAHQRQGSESENQDLQPDLAAKAEYAHREGGDQVKKGVIASP
jgi:hypothetical protein